MRMQNRGFVLVEVLVSLVVVSSVVAISMMIFSKLADVQKKDANKRKAIFAAKYELERLSTRDYSNLTPGAYTETVDSVVNEVGYMPGASLQYAISEVDLNGDGINDSKEIDVRVTW